MFGGSTLEDKVPLRIGKINMPSFSLFSLVEDKVPLRIGKLLSADQQCHRGWKIKFL